MQEPDDLQPWVPDEIAKILRVGARVRVRLSGECSVTMKCCGFTIDCHFPEVEGHIGTIVPPDPDNLVSSIKCKRCGAIDSHPEQHGHTFWVLFDFSSLGYDGSVFAASELEPIDESP